MAGQKGQFCNLEGPETVQGNSSKVPQNNNNNNKNLYSASIQYKLFRALYIKLGDKTEN